MAILRGGVINGDYWGAGVSSQSSRMLASGLQQQYEQLYEQLYQQGKVDWVTQGTYNSVSTVAYSAPNPYPPTVETAVMWLDRRITEMRVKL